MGTTLSLLSIIISKNKDIDSIDHLFDIHSYFTLYVKVSIIYLSYLWRTAQVIGKLNHWHFKILSLPLIAVRSM